LVRTVGTLRGAVEDELIRIAESELPQGVALEPWGDPTDLAAELRGRATRRLGEEAADVTRIIERSVHLIEHEVAEDRRLSQPIAKHFGEALAITKFLRGFTRALAQLHKESYDPPEGADAVDWETEALSDLFWMGHLIVGEIILLLETGFAAGALARWRALRELVLRAKLVRIGGAPVARRFREHEEWRWRKQRGGTAFTGDPDADAIKVAEWESLDADLKQRYGRAFFGEYGWAHNIMRQIDPQYPEKDRPRGPLLEDVDRAVEAFGGFGAHQYGDASFAVHGSALSVCTDDAPVADIRRGPSPSDVPDVGSKTCGDLGELTRVYVSRDPDNLRMRRLVWALAAVTDTAEDGWEIVEDEAVDDDATQTSP